MNVLRRAPTAAVSVAVALVLGGGLATGLLLMRRARARRDTIRRVPCLARPRSASASKAATAQVRVVYASESGNAESLAKGLVRTLQQGGVTAVLIDPASWEHLQTYVLHSTTTTALLPSPTPPLADGKAVYLFVLATAGAGEPPVNFMTLYYELERVVTGREATAPFAHVYYAVFGLGDSAYKNYCRCAVVTKSFLKKGGATELHRIGFGDASRGNEEEVFEGWQAGVLRALDAQCGLHVRNNAQDQKPPTPRLRVCVLGDTTAPLRAAVPFPPTADSATWPTASHPTAMRLLRRERLTPPRADDQSAVYRLTFATSCVYQGGDHLGVYPANPAAVVHRCACLLGLSAQTLRAWVVLQERDDAADSVTQLLASNVLPSCVPLAVVLERYVDLCGRPKRATLRVLAAYCTDPAERAAFDALLTDFKPDPDAPRTVLDYLERFPGSRRISIDHFLEIVPRLRPRYYSIASDALVQPREVTIYVRALVDGLASSYLCTRLQDDGTGVVYGFVRSSSFHLPSQRPGRPLLLIGPGTGIAGIVGLCHRREALLRRQPTLAWGPCVCFFGARHRESEYFVSDVLERWARTPDELGAEAQQGERATRLPCAVITLLDCAFSRDAPEAGATQPRYVTHLIEKHADYLCKLLMSDVEGGAMVFVSGDASRMAKDVDRALAAVLQEKGNLSRLEAVEFLQRMEHERRYLRDVY